MRDDEAQLPSPSIQIDPSTGRPVLVAPRRRLRPIHIGSQASGSCPFCPGEETQTPPEIDAVRDPDSQPDRRGWRVRAFPNKFPAASQHVVVAEGDVHEVQPGRLGEELWQDAITVWRRRLVAIERLGQKTFLFKNVGQRAGASIAHNHTQILGLPEHPPRLQLELLQMRQGCALCRELDGAAAEGRIVHAGAAHVVLSPRVPKLPFETWLLPRAHDADFLESSDTADLAASLQAWFVAVDLAFRDPPFNFWLHRAPGEDFHWHFELQPRTGNVAGLELGGDMYINSITAAECAAMLRAKR
jgi:UDPglucose--hexose-1-phosphate uridylyltransferase